MSGSVTVVFDASAAPPGLPPEQVDRGIRIVFARAGQEADDVIEQLIAKDSAAKGLQVVSDDHRLQQVGRRRGCKVLGCEEFLTWLLKQRKAGSQKPGPPEKKDSISANEVQRWLEEFSDIERDPSLRKAFEPDDFQ
jgi:predicted RNA-binding protein with PIN domain